MKTVLTLLAFIVAVNSQCSVPKYTQNVVHSCNPSTSRIKIPNYANVSQYYACNNNASVTVTCPMSTPYFSYVLQQCCSCNDYIPAVPCSDLTLPNKPSCTSLTATPTTTTPRPTTTTTARTTTTTKRSVPTPSTNTTTTTSRSPTVSPPTSSPSNTPPSITPPGPGTATGIPGPPSPSTSNPNLATPPTPMPTPPNIPDQPPFVNNPPVTG